MLINKKLIFTFFLFLALIISGCGQKTSKKDNNKKEVDVSDWKIYSNKEYGYTMRYPKDWTIEEVNYYDEEFKWRVKNITFKSPNKEYYLIFGLAGKDEDINFSPRTGFGATDKILKERTIIISGTEVEVLYSVYGDAVQEVYYSKINPQREPYEYFEVNNFLAHATLGAKKSYDQGFDFREKKELKIADEILKSFTFAKK